MKISDNELVNEGKLRGEWHLESFVKTEWKYLLNASALDKLEFTKQELWESVGGIVLDLVIFLIWL